MRPILFRGKDKISGNWIIGDLIHWVGYYKEDSVYILPIIGNLAYTTNCKPLDCVEVIPETVGQYTGLDDINGVKIFEGDRITRINTYRKRETGIARFNSGCFCVERLGDHNEWEYLDCWEQFFKNCKVTGTIFDEELKEIKKAINDRR